MEIKYIDNLPVDRWKEYKELRINGLENDPIAFTPDLEETLKDTEENWRNRLQNNLNGERVLIFAEHDGKLVGCGNITLYEMERFKHNVNFDGLYVRPEYRGRGIGEKLVKERLERAEKMPKVTQVFTEIFSSQIASIDLHKKLDFVEVGRIKDFVHMNDKYYDSIFMQKRLK